MLTEEIERLIWNSLSTQLNDFGIRLVRGLAGRGLRIAAAAIAARLSEGVAYEGPAVKQGEWPVLSDDEVRRLQAAMKKLDDGQLVEVIVRIVEGTKDAGED